MDVKHIELIVSVNPLAVSVKLGGDADNFLGENSLLPHAIIAVNDIAGLLFPHNSVKHAFVVSAAVVENDVVFFGLLTREYDIHHVLTAFQKRPHTDA
jgi:hypothetical protein